MPVPSSIEESFETEKGMSLPSAVGSWSIGYCVLLDPFPGWVWWPFAALVGESAPNRDLC